MSDNIQRGQGRGQNYRFDRGGVPAEFGPFIGKVKKNVDPTRSGTVWVYIDAFSGPDEEDESLWRKVRYAPPFFGITPPTGTSDGAGTYPGNQLSYGMWFTGPDLGTELLCFFVDGDKDKGYYFGCRIDTGMTHMVPAIGASSDFVITDAAQQSYLAQASQLPVTEINSLNSEIDENPRFYTQPKPVQSYVAAIMMQQGLITDTVRGPIRSNSQRESPSAVFGVSTPGRAIYQGGLSEVDIQQQLDSGNLRPQDVKVIGRRGGHSLVMDDGDLEGTDNLIRIRTSKGHQITMSDDGDCFYITHANGQTWIELGKQGTVDVFSTNSVNVRTQGTINLHADRDINMFAGGAVNIKSAMIKAQADTSLTLIGTQQVSIYSKTFVGVKTDGTLALQSQQSGSWNAGKALGLEADCINLNGGGGVTPVQTPQNFVDYNLSDTVFTPDQGWQVRQAQLKTIVTRAPTHEPYPYHNQGVNAFTELGGGGGIFDAFSDVVSGTLDNLVSSVLDNPLQAATLLTQTPAQFAVGTLGIPDVTGLMAQGAQIINQPFGSFDLTKGIGKFGFNPSQLEEFGFLKPGSVESFRAGAFQDTTGFDWLQSPSVWTGREGVASLDGLLSNETIQDTVQNQILSGALSGLQQSGLVTGRESPSGLGALVQTAARFGVNNTVDWTRNAAPAELVSEMNQWAKSGQYAVNFVQSRLPNLGATGVRLGGFTNTVERNVVDQAVAQIIGNAKIPVPNFSAGIFSNLPNSELNYSGDNASFWDQFNNERLRRGLGGLDTPRPSDPIERYEQGGPPTEA